MVIIKINHCSKLVQIKQVIHQYFNTAAHMWWLSGPGPSVWSNKSKCRPCTVHLVGKLELGRMDALTK